MSVDTKETVGETWVVADDAQPGQYFTLETDQGEIILRTDSLGQDQNRFIEIGDNKFVEIVMDNGENEAMEFVNVEPQLE